MNDDAETLHLKLHPVLTVANHHIPDIVPTLGDDQQKAMHQFIIKTKT